MNKITIYSSLPYWLQNIAVSLHGYKLKRQRFNDDFYKILDFLNSTHGWSKEQIRSYKEEHTFKILEQAYNHCPYYRKKYANVGLSPSDFKRLEDLRKFPILTKEEIRKNWQGMVADNVSKEDLIYIILADLRVRPWIFIGLSIALPIIGQWINAIKIVLDLSWEKLVLILQGIPLCQLQYLNLLIGDSTGS